jgi:hypothetical protein
MSYKRISPQPVAEGGTGAQTLTAHGVLVGEGTSAVTPLVVGTDGQLLCGASAADPAFTTVTSSSGTINFTTGAHTLAIDANASLQITTGFASWGGAGNYFDDTTLGSFTILRPGTGYIHSKLVSWTAPQTVAGMTAGNTYYIYIDSTGTIGKTPTLSDALYADNIVLFECLRDSTPVTNNQITVKDNHPYQFPEESSFYLHEVVGTVIENNNNGANITLNGTQKIQINGADELADHGLYTTIPDSGGIGVTWRKMYTDGAGKWATQNNTDSFTGFWNNAGTPTALSAGNFGVYTLYVSKDTLTSTTPTYFAVLNTAQFANQGQATTAIANGTTARASNELSQLEICQLGYIVYRQSTAAITVVTVSKATLKQTLSTSGTNTAALVTTNTSLFDGILSAADTNVQAALDTIDDWGKGATNHGILIGRGVNTPIVASTLTDGQLLIGKSGGFDPVAASLSAGAGISITPGAGTISIAATGAPGGVTWTAVTVNAGLTVNTGTIANKAGLLTMTLPATAAIGDILEFTNINTAVGLRVAQNANQAITLAGTTSTVGVGGYVETTQLGDSLKMICTVAGASTRWQALSIIGNFTVA